MGARRRKRTRRLKEMSQPTSSGNSSTTARNLRKSDLGGVILGCKYKTIKECFSKQLFGLPFSHFPYVKHIDPGLTLFLFNYSDRKLLGIFEATSCGQLNIDPYAWTTDGSEYSPYAAQVKFKVRMLCQPLQEDQFGPIIAENYFGPRLFWFELDRLQTNKLIAVFSSSVVTTRISVLPFVGTYSNQRKISLPSNVRQEGTSVKVSAPEGNMELGSALDYPALSGGSQRLKPLANDEGVHRDERETLHKSGHRRSHLSVIGGVKESARLRKWSSLFKEETSSIGSKEVEDFKASVTKVNPLHTDKSRIPSEGSSSAWCLERPGQSLQDPLNKELVMYDELSYSAKGKIKWSFSGELPCSDKEKHPQKFYLDEIVNEVLKEENIQRNNHQSSYASAETWDIIECGEVHDDNPLDLCFSGADTERKSSSLDPAVAKLVAKIQELKLSHFHQVQQIKSLEEELAESREEIRQLKNQPVTVESGSSMATGHVEEEEPQLITEFHLTTDDLILVVGGYDGSSWLSTIDSYLPSQDLMRSCSSMPYVRTFSSPVKQEGELYLLGGGRGNLWYKTVDSYNLITDEWVRQPSLSQGKGSLAGVSLNKNIFAIGSRNGVHSLSQVEMFDPVIGKWIPTCSMQYKRHGLAAAELNGVLYAVGGHDGNGYLNSVERFDPRQDSWTRLKSMTTKRGYHSLIVLNEKLYAIGGHFGGKMVPTTEIFDPRAGYWMLGESMNYSRGCSGAFVSNDLIFVFGGLKNDGEALESVECYKEGHGWWPTDLKAIGKRCCFSAHVV